MFSGKDVPAVGVSFGIERIFTIMEQRIDAEAAAAGKKPREDYAEVLCLRFAQLPGVSTKFSMIRQPCIPWRESTMYIQAKSPEDSLHKRSMHLYFVHLSTVNRYYDPL